MNPIIEGGLPPLGAARDAVVMQFPKAQRNETSGPEAPRWIPIIPLCGTAKDEVIPPTRMAMKDSDLGGIIELIASRFKALLPQLVRPIPSWPLRLLLNGGGHMIVLFGKTKLKSYLRKQLNDDRHLRNE